ncbi:hypothetical protein BGZ65_003498, partial [Modicella reniformis]
MFDEVVQIVNWEDQNVGIMAGADTMSSFLDARMNNAATEDQDPMAPFFFPKLLPSGPDLVFVLRIGERKYPVFVQSKFCNQDRLTPKIVNDALDTTLATNVSKHLEKSLDSYCPDGYYFSMLVTLPSEAADVDPTKLERMDGLEPILMVLEKRNGKRLMGDDYDDLFEYMRTKSHK